MCDNPESAERFLIGCGIGGAFAIVVGTIFHIFYVITDKLSRKKRKKEVL